MKARRAFWLFFLLYITLDLALPAMPGAFVFSAADSVESVQVRARAAVETFMLPVPVRDSFVLSRQPEDRLAGPLVAGWIEPEKLPAPISRSRPARDPAPPSEDPH